MKEKILQYLQNKYEYLDFDDTIVSECFLSAYQYVQKKVPHILKNENTVNLELEYHFLDEIVLQIQKGNQEIYDSILIGLEYVHKFFLLKRPDLGNRYSKVDQKELYEMAFQNTIDQYDTKEPLQTALIRNLIFVYRNMETKEDDNMAKYSFHSFQSKYDMKEASLYTVLKQYKKEAIDIAISLFKRESNQKALLVRKYGRYFDGKNAANDLSFGEKDRLEKVLTLLTERVEAIEILFQQGKNEEQIKKMLKDKKDTELISIFSNVKSESKKIHSSKYVYRNKKEILNSLKITEEELEAVIYYIKDSDERIIYKYTYGIGSKAFEEAKILEMYHLDEKEYKEVLLDIQKTIPMLIQQYRVENAHIQEELPEDTKVKTSASTSTETKVLEKKEEKESHVIEKKKATPKENKKGKPGKSRPVEIFDYFYTDEMTEDEKKDIKERALAVLNLHKTSFSYETAKKLYGENFNHLDENVVLTHKERNGLPGFIRYIREELEKYPSIENIPRKGKREKFSTFFDYFWTEEMPEEEKEEIKEKVLLIVEKKKELCGYFVVVKLYGASLDHLNENIVLTKNENVNFKDFIHSIQTGLQKSSISENKETLSEGHVKKLMFFDYFWTEEMTEEEKEDIKERVLKILELKKNTKAYQMAVKLYGENLNQLNKQIKLDKQENGSFYGLIRFIKVNLEQYPTLDSIPTHRKNQRPIYFMEYFYTQDMTEEEKVEINQLVLMFAETRKNTKTYQVAVKLYGEDLNELQKGAVSEENDSQMFNSFILALKGDLEKKRAGKDVCVSGKREKNNTFFKYFYTDEMTEDEKEEINQRVQILVEKRKKLKGYQSVILQYGESLDQYNKNVTFGKEEMSSFYAFIKAIKKGLKKASNFALAEPKNRTRRQTYFEYFYEEEMTLLEKNEIDHKVTNFLLENQKLAGYNIVCEIWGESFNQLNPNFKLEGSHSALRYIISKTREYLDHRPQKKSLKENDRRQKKQTYFEYYQDLDEVQDMEHTEFESLIKEFVQLNMADTGAVLATQKFGEDLKTLNRELGFTNRNYTQFSRFNEKVTECIKQGIAPYDFRIQYQTIFDMIYEKGMTEEEKCEFKTLIEKKLEILNFLDPKLISIIEKQYGSDYCHYQVDVKLDKKEQQQLYNFKYSMRKKWKEQKELHVAVEETAVTCVEEARTTLKVEEEVVVEEKSRFIATDYLESLLWKAHELYGSPSEVSKMLKMDFDFVVDFYIAHLEEMDCAQALIHDIVVWRPEKIKPLLESSYFEGFKDALTMEEQEVIYLKLLSYSKPSFTDELISMITGIDRDTISNYEIMTNKECLNQLNEYIKK